MASDIKLLQRYRVDRADGVTLAGPEKLVVLVLKPLEGPEVAIALSSVDAMMLSMQLSTAAHDAKSAG